MPPFIFNTLRSVARKTLPQSARRLLIRGYFRTETILKGSLEKRAARRRIALPEFKPALPRSEFANGPILMVNNGLASGGVERQIVNSLQVLGHRKDRVFGLLCLRLGEESDLDFFRPALADFPGIVRNAMSTTAAKQLLARIFPKPKRKDINRLIGWFPSDVQQDILRLAAEFAVLKPSVVHAWQDGSGIPAAYAARIIGVPRIMISTRNVRPTNFVWYRPYMYLAHREFARCADIVMINNSEAGAADYARWLELPVSRFVVKRNGLDTSTMRRASSGAVAELRARLGIPSHAPVLGSIFRFYEEKRPLLWMQVAVEVARRDPRCHFVIFGGGPLQSATQAAADRAGISDRFHCPGTIPDAATGLSPFDVFLLTSKFEGTPNVVLEASMLGVPVVATEAGGTREAIEEGVTGYLVEQIEPTAIADRVMQILQAPEWRERVKTEGPAFVERRFGLNRMIAETLALYGLPADSNARQ